MESLSFEVAGSENGQRADVVVAGRCPEFSRALVRKLFDAGHVQVAGQVARPSRRVHAGEQIEARFQVPPSLTAEPQDIPLQIVYQDGELAVIDKPAGLAVHPAPGRPGGTLANALVARFPQAAAVGSAGRPGIVHRLDMDTSGLMVVALSARAQVSLQAQISDRSMRREYLALVTGHIEPAAGTIDAPVGRDATTRNRMAVHGIAPRDARTSYEVLERLPGTSYLRAWLHTGRTHQIRVHMAALGHPVAGDRLYHGLQLPGLSRQFLHAHTLAFLHPATRAPVRFESPLPAELRSVLDYLQVDMNTNVT